MKTTTSVRVRILAAAAAAALFLLAGSTSASASSGSNNCCQMPSRDGTPSCFHASTQDRDECAEEGGQLTSGTCNGDTGLCGGTEVCCSEAEGPSCTEVTAEECADEEGTSVLGEMCDAEDRCRNCLPEGSACPAGGSPVGTFDTGACCSGRGQCALLGIVPVDCSIAIVDVPPVFTCNCAPYYEGESLNESPSNMAALFYGAGAVGLLLPARRRRGRQK
jgi:hypothetical protein